MKTSDPKSIADCLHSNALKHIVQRAKQLSFLSTVLENHLPPEIKPHCQVMNLSNTTLILQVDNAAWSTRIRYLIPSLIETFSQHEMLITAIRCRINFPQQRE